MLKWVASFTLNRLFALGLIWLVINAYSCTGCQAGASFTEPFERAISWFQNIARALE